jgi:hypothetical protein
LLIVDCGPRLLFEQKEAKGSKDVGAGRWGGAWPGRGVPAVAKALAWGPEGHKIAATIATANLTPQAQAGVKQLLSNQTPMDVSTWADEIKSDHRYDWAKPLHCADMLPEATIFDPKRDVPKEGCVVTAIPKYAAILRDDKATPSQRAEALKLLVHFVADVHQPLHVTMPRAGRS